MKIQDHFCCHPSFPCFLYSFRLPEAIRPAGLLFGLGGGQGGCLVGSSGGSGGGSSCGSGGRGGGSGIKTSIWTVPLSDVWEEFTAHLIRSRWAVEGGGGFFSSLQSYL